MAIYSLANRTTNTTTGNDCLEIIGSASLGYKLLELGIMINAATQSVFGFGRPAVIGGSPTSPVTVLTEDGGNTSAGLTTTALAWGGSQPTIPANFARRVNLPATAGAGIILTFPRGFGVLKALTSTVWNLSTVSVADIWIVVDE